MSEISRAVGLVFLFGMLGQLVSAAPPLPNVVIIFADDMGDGDLEKAEQLREMLRQDRSERN